MKAHKTGGAIVFALTFLPTFFVRHVPNLIREKKVGKRKPNQQIPTSPALCRKAIKRGKRKT